MRTSVPGSRQKQPAVGGAILLAKTASMLYEQSTLKVDYLDSSCSKAMESCQNLGRSAAFRCSRVVWTTGTRQAYAFLGLLLGTGAPAMLLNGITCSFPFLLV